MKALTFHVSKKRSVAPAPRIVELPIPEPQANQILVRVHYAGLNNFDIETSEGKRNGAVRRALKKSQVVSGIEMAGIAGSDGNQIKKGDRVVGYTHIFNGPFFHAQYVAVPEDQLAIVPENVSLEGATSIVGGALTTISALERIAGLQPGDAILITGATGSVGVTAVQLAAHLGAEVSAVCHSKQGEFARSQGATHVYAYDNNELPETAGQFNVIFDTAPALSFASASRLLTSHGCYITTMPQLDISGFIKGLFSSKKWGYLMEYKAVPDRMDRLVSLISENAFHSTIDSVFVLADAAQALQRQLRPSKQGKILIDFR